MPWKPDRPVYERVMRVKCLARTGWMQRGVPPAVAETVAGHSFEAAALAYLIAWEAGVDPYKAAVAALMHDAAEALVGDIPLWSSQRMAGLKESLEMEAFKELGLEEEAGLLRGDVGLVVRAADLLATAMQARRYVEEGYSEAEEIYASSKEALCSLVAEKLVEAEGIIRVLLGERC